MAKERQILTVNSPLIFDGGSIRLEHDGSIILNQSRQCKNLTLVNLTNKAIDLKSSRGRIRKAITPKDQYVAQRALGAYIASMCQPEAAFDLSFAAQTVNHTEQDAIKLNKRIQWQINNHERGLQFVRLENTISLVVYTDGSFANNIDNSSQIRFVIVLADTSGNANIVHWSSIKCKRVTQSVLASELYGMAHGFDYIAVIRSTLEQTLDVYGITNLPLIVCTDSKSLYDYLVKLGSTTEKRLMVDLMCLRQSYERRLIAEIR